LLVLRFSVKFFVVSGSVLLIEFSMITRRYKHCSGKIEKAREFFHWHLRHIKLFWCVWKWTKEVISSISPNKY